MNIQIIAYNDIGHRFGGLSQAVNTFDKAMVFDDFDVNIIDLTDQNLWRNKSDNYNQISCNNDLKTLGKLIRDTSNSKIVLLLPGNIPFHYCGIFQPEYASALFHLVRAVAEHKRPGSLSHGSCLFGAVIIVSV